MTDQAPSRQHALRSESLGLSVVVPARNSAPTLRRTLDAIRASALPVDSYELIVVDDVSGDDSVAIAARYADTVIKLSGGPCGVAYSRNRGAELARGQVVAFVDPDVVVGQDTLPRMLAMLTDRPDIDAVSASHDESSGASNFVSQYWNLLLRYGEARHAGRCAQFVPGCGMVRRAAFHSAGMYDEWRFTTGSLESAELGGRLRDKGQGVVLSSEVSVTHLTRWSLASVGKEVWRRGRLLARSLGYVRMSVAAPSEVVFTLTRALIPAVGVLGTLLLAAAFLPSGNAMAIGGTAVAALLVSNLPVHRFYARSRGLGFAVASAPLHVFAQLIAIAALCNGWILRDVFGDPSPDATTQAYAEVGLEMWPPVRRRV